MSCWDTSQRYGPSGQPTDSIDGNRTTCTVDVVLQPDNASADALWSTDAGCCAQLIVISVSIDIGVAAH